MQLSLSQAIQELKTLEPVFMAAGDVIADTQQKIINEGRHHQKFDTGNAAIDIVTEADLLSQETILSALARTPLVECELFAEEKMVLTDQFAKESPYYITIDPLDGTKRFTDSSPIFSVIVQLHDAHRPHYTFLYYPRFKWWLRMAGDTMEQSGPAPEDAALVPQEKTIISSSITRSDDLLPPVVETLKAAGFRFQTPNDLPGRLGSNFWYLFGDLDGYFCQSRNIYDGGVAYHSALVRGHLIRKAGFDRAAIRQTPSGGVYQGFLLALDPTRVAETILG